MGRLEPVMDDSLASEPGSLAALSRLLIGGAALAVVLGAATLSGGIALHFVGYALASLLAFSLIALFRRQSLERTVNAGIGVPHWLNLAAIGVLIAGFLVSVAQSWLIASHFS
jgi:hypothetical protein